jgi:hypothetical protein
MRSATKRIKRELNKVRMLSSSVLGKEIVTKKMKVFRIWLIR